MSNAETYKQGYSDGRDKIIEIISECFEYFKGNDNLTKVKEKFFREINNGN